MSGTRCTANAKQSGERCRRRATPGKEVCVIHGSRTPAGIASPHTIHGRYSTALPGRLLERYRVALADEVLLEQRDEVAVLEARLVDVLGRVESGESGAVWIRLGKQLAAYRAARRSGESGTAAAALAELEDLVDRGLADYAAWSEIRSLIEQRRRLVESERKRLVELQQMITTEQAMTLLAAVADTVRTHVTDRDALAAISADLGRLVAVQPRRTA